MNHSVAAFLTHSGFTNVSTSYRDRFSEPVSNANGMLVKIALKGNE